MFNEQASKTTATTVTTAVTTITTALCYHVASKEPHEMYLDNQMHKLLCLDNQMHKLLCYANEQGFDSLEPVVTLPGVFHSLPKGGGRA